MLKLKVLGEYLGHLAMGAAMFAGLLLFGGALNLLVQATEPIVNDVFFTQLMSWVEKIILYADIAFVVWWSVFSTYKAIRKIMAD